jgi:hypothetical protein
MNLELPLKRAVVRRHTSRCYVCGTVWCVACDASAVYEESGGRHGSGGFEDTRHEAHVVGAAECVVFAAFGGDASIGGAEDAGGSFAKG